MKNKNATKYKSNLQEQRKAKDLKTHVVVASGALWSAKGDVRNDRYLVECKTTKNSYYSLTIDTWNKIKKQANKDGLRIPLMCIDVEDGKHSIAVMSYLDFMGLDFDTKAQYLGNVQPILVENKSFRVTADFIGADFPQSVDVGQYPCYRMDFKFVDLKTHLVCLPWEDFIYIDSQVTE